MDQHENKHFVKSAGLSAVSLAGATPRSRIMPDFSGFWIVFKCGVMSLESPQCFNLQIHSRILTNGTGGKAHSIRPEPFGLELMAERLMAEGSTKS